jgi:hypothetical protein
LDRTEKIYDFGKWKWMKLKWLNLDSVVRLTGHEGLKFSAAAFYF